MPVNQSILPYEVHLSGTVAAVFHLVFTRQRTPPGLEPFFKKILG